MARTTNRNGEVRIGTDATWRHVSTGMRQGAVVRADGSLWCWGYGARGRHAATNCLWMVSTARSDLDLSIPAIDANIRRFQATAGVLAMLYPLALCTFCGSVITRDP